MLRSALRPRAAALAPCAPRRRTLVALAAAVGSCQRRALPPGAAFPGSAAHWMSSQAQVGGLGQEADLLARFRKMQADREPESDPKMPAPQHTMQQKPDCGEDTYHGSGKMSGKVALITGGDSGIGRAVAIAFAREGADVAIVYYTDDEAKDAEDTKRICEAAGRRCIALQLDVSKRANCTLAIKHCVDELGGLTTLVNNAAVQYSEPSLEDACQHLEKVLSTNVCSNFWLAAEAVKHFKEDTGCTIIFTTSVNTYAGNKHLLAYSVSKAAQVGLLRSLSKKFSGRLCRVNGVAPGPIWTPFITGAMQPQMVEQFGDHNPMGRAGQPVECAPAFVYLASSDSSFVDGQVMHVDGGMTTAS